MPILDTVLSCSCSPSVSKNSGSISSVRLRSKAPMPRTWSGLTSDFVERTMGANLLIDRRRVSTAFKSSSLGTKSHLFRINLSAKATCSTLSFSARLYGLQIFFFGHQVALVQDQSISEGHLLHTFILGALRLLLVQVLHDALRID